MRGVPAAVGVAVVQRRFAGQAGSLRLELLATAVVIRRLQSKDQRSDNSEWDIEEASLSRDINSITKMCEVEQYHSSNAAIQQYCNTAGLVHRRRR